MKFSQRLLPLLSFFIFYGLIQLSFDSLKRSEEKQDEIETQGVLEVVAYQLQRYMELPYTLGSFGARHLQSGLDINRDNYFSYMKLVMETNPEFVGFNTLNNKGIIVHTFPSGQKSLGKVSQMYDELTKSLEKKESFYLSTPFRLYQEQLGFALYFPILSGKNLLGWYAIVISSENFLKKFAIEEFLKVFDLTIADEDSGKDYFATAIDPTDTETKVHELHTKLYDRKLTLKTWRKNPSPHESFPWYFSVGISLLLALAIDFILRLREHKRLAKVQLENIGILLRITSKEALNNLVEIHTELNELELKDAEKNERLSRDINYISNLIEQIDLLQTMTHSKESLSLNQINFYEMLYQQLDNFLDVTEKKKILVICDEKSFEKCYPKLNAWLFENSVLANILSHLFICARPGSQMRVEKSNFGDREAIVFRVPSSSTTEQTQSALSRRLEVAKKVMHLQQGDLRVEHKSGEELIITILLPS